MGMSDNIRFKQPMPDGHMCDDGWFQTKDLACDLDGYEVGEDGRLRKIEVCDPEEGMGTKLLDPPEDQDFHGWLTFYDYNRKTGDWHEYKAKFTDGQLVRIVTANTELTGRSGTR